MPATSIIGYPPAIMPPEKTGAQTCASSTANGWRRFKAPDGRDLGRCRARGCAQRAKRRPMPGSAPIWSGCSRPSTRRPPMPTAIADLDMGCIEDIFPPGNAGMLAELRKRVTMPIWQGDEQGGSYYPEALILARIGRSRPRRPDLHGRHHRRPRDHRRMPGRRRRFRPAHVRACPQPGVQRLGLRRQAGRMGRAMDRRRPLCRQPCAARRS